MLQRRWTCKMIVQHALAFCQGYPRWGLIESSGMAPKTKSMHRRITDPNTPYLGIGTASQQSLGRSPCRRQLQTLPNQHRASRFYRDCLPRPENAPTVRKVSCRVAHVLLASWLYVVRLRTCHDFLSEHARTRVAVRAEKRDYERS
jgi:hypothetical protein